MYEIGNTILPVVQTKKPRSQANQVTFTSCLGLGIANSQSDKRVWL